MLSIALLNYLFSHSLHSLFGSQRLLTPISSLSAALGLSATLGLKLGRPSGDFLGFFLFSLSMFGSAGVEICVFQTLPLAWARLPLLGLHFGLLSTCLAFFIFPTRIFVAGSVGVSVISLLAFLGLETPISGVVSLLSALYLAAEIESLDRRKALNNPPVAFADCCLDPLFRPIELLTNKC